MSDLLIDSWHENREQEDSGEWRGQVVGDFLDKDEHLAALCLLQYRHPGDRYSHHHQDKQPTNITVKTANNRLGRCALINRRSRTFPFVARAY